METIMTPMTRMIHYALKCNADLIATCRCPSFVIGVWGMVADRPDLQMNFRLFRNAVSNDFIFVQGDPACPVSFQDLLSRVREVGGCLPAMLRAYSSDSPMYEKAWCKDNRIHTTAVSKFTLQDESLSVPFLSKLEMELAVGSDTGEDERRIDILQFPDYGEPYEMTVDEKRKTQEIVNRIKNREL